MQNQHTAGSRRAAMGRVGVLALCASLAVCLFLVACPRGICLAAGGHPAEMYAHSVDICEMPEGSSCPRFFGPDANLPGIACVAQGRVAWPAP
jgi:hypothetical protein